MRGQGAIPATAHAMRIDVRSDMYIEVDLVKIRDWVRIGMFIAAFIFLSTYGLEAAMSASTTVALAFLLEDQIPKMFSKDKTKNS